MLGRFLYGIINNFNVVRGSTKKFRTEPGFSFYFPTINSADNPAIFSVKVEETYNAIDPSLPDNQSDLYLQFRLMIKDEIENPSTRTWSTYRRAVKLYEQRHVGISDAEWALLGYPIKNPESSEWFTELS